MPETPRDTTSAALDPPRTLGGTLRRMGPGMIIAGSIVGSGELIATTSVGAEAGFTLLWLILIGCAIKVFVQVELGRHTVTWSQTPLDALNRVPGPYVFFAGHPDRTRARYAANWIVVCWAVMSLLIITQQGGIVGGVGQALAIRMPVTEYGTWHNEKQNELIALRVEAAQAKHRGEPIADMDARVGVLALEIKEKEESKGGAPLDAHWWATGVALFTAVLMYFGRYGLIQSVSTIFVASFTLITIGTLIMLQRNGAWAVTGGEFAEGLKFKLPPATPESNPTSTALAAFGLIGVGSGELLMYPYWCMEKGYARFTGPRDASDGWATRARGWMRVMQFDAWGSMVVYTFATATFFLLGAAVLWRVGLNPSGDQMVRTLTQMYVPVFGDWAAAVFLFGAFAVLYSTFFVVTAGFSRMIADGLIVMGLIGADDATRSRWTRGLSVVWPLVAVALFWFVSAPKAMVLASGVAQAIMLPVIGLGALYFRYKLGDERLQPGKLWDAMLWVSFTGLLIAGCWTIASKLGWV